MTGAPIPIRRDPTAAEQAARERLAALLASVAEGDRTAFRDLYAATSARLFGLALSMLKSREVAEEVLQEAYVAVWRRAGTYRAGLGTPMTWLLAILRNRAIDRLRKLRAQGERVTVEIPEDLADPARSPFEWTATSEDGRRLQRCLDTLEPRQRESIVLAFVEGVTHEELAARIGIPLGTVKSWIRRGLARLKDCLG